MFMFLWLCTAILPCVYLEQFSVGQGRNGPGQPTDRPPKSCPTSDVRAPPFLKPPRGTTDFLDTTYKNKNKITERNDDYDINSNQNKQTCKTTDRSAKSSLHYIPNLKKNSPWTSK